ncbi:MAG TPA: integrase core domain-containing protein [Steroidobacteraceae bacterium]|nr:integrase core domain-containing protein [Steroidobacteraceae bacterium]
MIRQDAGLSVVRFCELAGIPESSWYRRRARVRGRQAGKGPWPAPKRREMEAVVHWLALRYPAWGYRKIWALAVARGYQVSMSTVYRVMFERGLVHEVRYQAERRELAKARRAVFHAPPTRRNRVWQTDFSELETRAGGIWQMAGVVDYVSKFCLTCPVTATKTWREAVACLEAARQHASEVLGRPLIEDLIDTESGEPHAIVVVTDNGSCYRARGFRHYIGSRPEFEHVRTRHRSPQTNGVIERWFQSLKYEHLYLQEIDDGLALAEHVAAFERIYNDERPHEAIDYQLPRKRYLQPPGTTEEAA